MATSVRCLTRNNKKNAFRLHSSLTYAVVFFWWGRVTENTRTKKQNKNSDAETASTVQWNYINWDVHWPHSSRLEPYLAKMSLKLGWLIASHWEITHSHFRECSSFICSPRPVPSAFRAGVRERGKRCFNGERERECTKRWEMSSLLDGIWDRKDIMGWGHLLTLAEKCHTRVA